MWSTFKNLFISVVLYLSFIPALAASELVPSTNVIDTRTFQWIQPSISRLESELGQVVRELREKGFPIDLASSGAYGSGFLRYVAVGRDLDYLAVVDLGSVEHEGSPERTILDRVEAVLKTFARRMDRGGEDPGLIPFGVDGLGKKGGLEKRSLIKVRLVEALNRLQQGSALEVQLRDSSGRMVPWLLPKGELVLPVSTKVFYFTNLARYREEMFQAIRTVSVELFFFVRIKDRDGDVHHLLIEPSHVKSGSRIILRNNQFFVVFPSPDRRRRLVKIVGQESVVSDRVASGNDLLSAAERELAKGRIIKSLKRLYQARELLGPMFSDQELAPLDEQLKKWFQAPAASVFNDLEEVAETISLSISSGHYKTFVAHESVDQTVKWYQSQCLKLSKNSADHRTLMLKLYDQLGRAGKSSSVERAGAWEKVQALTDQLSREMGPPREAVAEWILRFKQRLAKAGIEKIPVAGSLGDRIFVLAEALERLGIEPSLLRARAMGGYRFAVIPRDLAKEVLGANPDPPSRYFWLRLNPSEEEDRFFEQIRKRLSIEK